MTVKTKNWRPHRPRRQTVRLEIELPALSDEAAAVVADVLVQLYHRFEATYYAQILNHHAELALVGTGDPHRRDQSGTDADPF